MDQITWKVPAFSQLLASCMGHVIIQAFVLPSLPGILGLMGLGLQPMMCNEALQIPEAVARAWAVTVIFVPK